jgi:transposase-like protein
MTRDVSNGKGNGVDPSWLPDSFRLYLEHVEGGLTIRALARQEGCAPSTISRQVQKTEKRRDDPLVDSMLTDLGRLRRSHLTGAKSSGTSKDERPMKDDQPDEQTIRREGTRILRALLETGAVMAVTPNVDTAVVVVEAEDGRPVIRAKCDRAVAQAMAVKEWITGAATGRVARYRIAPAGRVVLNRFMAEDESAALGFAEAPAGFDHARPARAATGFFGRGHQSSLEVPRRRGQTVGLESPLRVLARRKDQKTGRMYLSPELVSAGERLQRDFEMSGLDVSGGFDWDGLMGGQGGTAPGASRTDRRMDAKARFEAAMAAVQPELGDMLLRVCCQEHGMEQVESDLQMPQRSGKFMLRIALQYLHRHYDGQAGEDHDLIW